jgi:dihydropteroate synthase
MINDIDALTAPGALDAVADTDCAVCLDAQARATLRPCSRAPSYADVALEVRKFLADRIRRL